MKKVTVINIVVIVLVMVLRISGCGGEQKGTGNETTHEKVQPKIVFSAKPFELTDVKLLDGPFKDAMELDRKYLHDLDADRLLHTFRLNAGLPSTAKPYGGWEAPNIELRGHSIGHYLSACAFMYASTGDEELKKKGEYIVAELAKCQKAIGDSGYLSAFPESFFDRVEALEPVWAPWYTLHKIYAGLADMYVYCGNKQALEVAEGMARWAKKRTDRLTDEQMQIMLKIEFGGMNEVFANLYALTGNADYLALAKRFDHEFVFTPLMKGKDWLHGLHANTQIPKIIGAAREYELTGEKKYHDIASFFWDAVISNRMYSIGGTSNYEHWRTPPSLLARELSVESAETCCTYNMLKLTRHLFEWTADEKYADYYERAIYNQILASQSPENGMVMYYVAMNPGHFKIYCTPEDSFWCCTGTGMENHAKYGDSIYYHDANGLFVNLFIASELNWADKEIVVRQETKYPQEDSTRITIETKRPVQTAIRIRIPYWATKGAIIKVNGQVQNIKTAAASYAAIERKWNKGDRIEVQMPMSLHLHRMHDDKKVASIMYGPLVLAGELGTEKLTREMQYVGDQRSQHNAPSIEVPVFVIDGKPLDEWVKPVEGKDLTFKTVNVGRPKDVELIPFYRLHGQRYALYWNLLNEQEYEKWKADKAEKEKQEAAKQAEDARKIVEKQVDSVIIGNEESEGQHNLQTNNSYSGQYAGGTWRDAREGGFFSYDLKVFPDAPMTLECKYWGGDTERTFEIKVNDVSLGTVEIESGHPEQFFEKLYPIPLDVTRDKEKVTVKFIAPADGYAGGVFGLRMLRGD